jgi:hypothetical protein
MRTAALTTVAIAALVLAGRAMWDERGSLSTKEWAPTDWATQSDSYYDCADVADSTACVLKEAAAKPVVVASARFEELLAAPASTPGPMPVPTLAKYEPVREQIPGGTWIPAEYRCFDEDGNQGTLVRESWNPMRAHDGVKCVQKSGAKPKDYVPIAADVPTYFTPSACNNLEASTYNVCVNQQWEMHRRSVLTPVRIVYPDRPPPKAIYECGATLPQPEHEKDPIVKIKILIGLSSLDGEVRVFNVDHYAASGAVYSRQDQYSINRALWMADDTVSWVGSSLKAPDQRMRGRLTQRRYIEQRFVEGKLKSTTTSTCRRVQDESR